MHSICSIQSHILKFQPFLTSFAIFQAFNDLFSAKWPWNWKTTNELWKGWNLAWYHHFTHIACVKKLIGLRQKLDALRVETWPSPSKYVGFQTYIHLLWKGWKLAWYYHSPTYLVLKCREGYGKNWMQFEYKLGHLLRSMRVSDENSTVTKAFHFFKLISTPDF